MIVQPNFLDHWKTRLLQSELGDDPLAPTYVLRLWGHCQEQRTHRFNKLSAPALAAICCFKTSPEQLWLAMQTSGFIEVKNTTVEVHEWDKYNSGLITSWANGRKGGRPRKPTGNPRVTHGEPGANPGVTDREDREEKKDKEAAKLPFSSPLFTSAWSDFCQHRVEIRKKLTPKATAGALEVLAKMGEPRAVAALRHTIAQGWQGIREPQSNGQHVAKPDPWEQEPEGWRAHWRNKYPPEDFPNAVRYDEQEWSTLSSYNRKFIWSEMRKDAGKRLAS